MVATVLALSIGVVTANFGAFSSPTEASAVALVPAPTIDLCTNPTRSPKGSQPCRTKEWEHEIHISSSGPSPTLLLVILVFLVVSAIVFGIWWKKATPAQQERFVDFINRHENAVREGQARARESSRQRRYQQRLTTSGRRDRRTYRGHHAGQTLLYRFFDRDGKLLYIGITHNIERRTAQHRSDKPWAALIHRTTVDVYLSRKAAFSAERRAIRRERPRYNVVHNQRWYKL